MLVLGDDVSEVEMTVQALRRDKLADQIHVVNRETEALDFILCRGLYKDRSVACPLKLVLLDLKFPEAHGFAIVRAIKEDERTKTIPVVLFTRSSDHREMTEAYRLGINACVRKPADFTDFCLAVLQIGVFWLKVNESPHHDACIDVRKALARSSES
jgi:CheY-like chemotaxis protein